MATIDISISIPPLPEGWQSTPDELLEWVSENAIFSYDGAFLTGQIGGTRPTEDNGIWFGDNSIERFRDGKYRPISDVPIGTLMPFASAANIPENYLLCDGRSLIRLDYFDLFEVIGTTWGSVDATTFNLPDMRGRLPVGSGIGDYEKQGVIGRMKEILTGAYRGSEWPGAFLSGGGSEGPWPSAPLAKLRYIASYLLQDSSNYYTPIANPSAGMPYIIRYR